MPFLLESGPPLGYKTYFLVPAEQAETFPNASTVKLDDPNPAKPKTIFEQDQVENEFYRVTVDRATGGR